MTVGPWPRVHQVPRGGSDPPGPGQVKHLGAAAEHQGDQSTHRALPLLQSALHVADRNRMSHQVNELFYRSNCSEFKSLLHFLS